MKIYFASDHAGFELKNALVVYLRDEKGIDVTDCGADSYNETDDFTEFIPKAIKALSDDMAKGIVGNKAIILGGSGEGEAMAANRFSGIRATVYYGGDKKILEVSEEHNNANVLSLGARFLSIPEAKEAVDIWLAHSFKGEEKYERRNEALDELTS
jgi:ribose 5-phosphate isomerase B